MPTLESLLERTSRTFALSIPVLPEPTRREVMLAYLLFRIADTFEDAAHWRPELRIEALREFEGLLSKDDRREARRLAEKWERSVPARHEGYCELVREVPFVLEAFFALRPEAIEPIRSHVSRSARGMSGFIERGRDGGVFLETLQDLRDYCYAVAGIVGEMLTDLFLLGRDRLRPIATALRDRAPFFGEALQLVNVLKDAAVDRREGRLFIPAAVPRSEVFALARRDLGIAREYTLALQQAGAPRGIVEFCALPAELAWATLEKVEAGGPGSKISRVEVFAISHRLDRALDRGEPAVRGR